MRILLICSFLMMAAPQMSFAQMETSAADAAKTSEAEAVSTALQTFGTKAQTPVVPNPAAAAGAATAAPIKANVEAAAKALLADIQACNASIKRANMLCLESTSPALGGFIAEYGTLLQGLGMTVKGMANECSGIGKALDLANGAITAFQVACGTAQSMCTSACGKVEASAKAYSAAAQSTATPAVEQASAKAHQTNAAMAEAKVKSAISLCASYKVSVKQAISGAVMTLIQMKTAKKCNDDNSSGTAQAANLDCTKTENPNYATVNCQCARNELPAAQCQGITLSPNSVGNGNGIAVGAIDPGLNTDGLSGPNVGGGASEEFGGGSASGQSLAGAPVDSGGGGGLGGGGGGGSGFSQDGVGQGKKLNANVLGGFGGGGGGGGFGAGPGYGETDSKLKEYGPGGAKDPSRSVASEIAKQVTAEAGRSNWEKVRSRYRDNQRTLLNK